MANFPTHITTSAALGTAYGTAAHVVYGMPLPGCLLAGGLFTIAGVLPDVDSDNAVILREILAFVAAVIPMLLLDRFREMGWHQESIVVASGLTYVSSRYFSFTSRLKTTTKWLNRPAPAMSNPPRPTLPYPGLMKILGTAISSSPEEN